MVLDVGLKWAILRDDGLDDNWEDIGIKLMAFPTSRCIFT